VNDHVKNLKLNKKNKLSRCHNRFRLYFAVIEYEVHSCGRCNTFVILNHCIRKIIFSRDSGPASISIRILIYNSYILLVFYFVYDL